MNLSLILACVWVVTANLVAMLPSRDNHWTYAYILIGCGIPLLGYVTYENGPWWGLALLLVGMSILRWPVIYFWRWITRR